MRIKIATITAAAMLAGAWTASAVLVYYTVDGVTPQQFASLVNPPANAPHVVDGQGYPGDTVELQTYTGTLDLTPGTYTEKINTLLWTVSWTYGGTATDPDAWSDLSFAVNAARNIHFSDMANAPLGNTALSQAGSLLVTWNLDTLSFSGGSTVSLNVGGYQVDITPLAVAPSGAGANGNPPWVQNPQDMMATFVVIPVPEPTTMMIAGELLLLPFGASIVRFLRKQRPA